MKLLLAHILFFSMLVPSNDANAQARRSGLGRGISDYEQNSSRKSAEPVDQVQAYTDHMTKELSLDGFQAAIVKNIIKDYVDKTSNIATEAIPDQGKYEKMQVEIDKMEAKIAEILNADQKVKFQELKDKRNKKGKKSKKKGKEKEVTAPDAPAVLD